MAKVRVSGGAWRTSTLSRERGGRCVEVALVENTVMVRDSKRPEGPVLVFTPDEWTAFLVGAKGGEFDPA
jgi:hypothetical protein